MKMSKMETNVWPYLVILQFTPNDWKLTSINITVNANVNIWVWAGLKHRPEWWICRGRGLGKLQPSPLFPLLLFLSTTKYVICSPSPNKRVAAISCPSMAISWFNYLSFSCGFFCFLVFLSEIVLHLKMVL